MNFRKLAILIALLLGGVTLFIGTRSKAHDEEPPGGIERGGNGQPNGAPLEERAFTPCQNGMAGNFPCDNVDLLAFLPNGMLGGGTGNEVWGWTDPLTGKEYALYGRSSGTSFVDLSTPDAPVYLGNLPANAANSTWRSIRVYANYAFIGSEATNHGMQIFDLTRLRNVAAPPATFTSDTVYTGFGRSHTITINEDTGFIYANGTTGTCSGGLHMVNVKNPRQPVFAGCYAGDGYTHESQCVIYNGPDVAHQGKEICFAANEDTITVVDVTNKATPIQLSRTTYAGVGYTHQGWLTDDHAYFLLNDELDERNNGGSAKTYVWNMTNIDAPQLINVFQGATISIDHNLYIRGNYAFEANYRSGLRILNINGIATGNLQEIGFFDIYPVDNAPSFNGAWLNYPFFKSGIVLISGIEQGLFIVRPTNIPKPPIEILTEFNSERAVAVDSVTLKRDFFAVRPPIRFGTDDQTRVTLFVRNLNANLGLGVTAEAEDYLHNIFPLTVENVSATPDLPGVTQVTVKLPLEIAGKGSVGVTLRLNGAQSNKAHLRISSATR